MDWNFVGTSNVRTDAKARLAVPATVRRQLEERGDARLTLAPSLFEPAIQCFPHEVWAARVAVVAGLSNSDPVARLVRKTQFALAAEATLDAHGRVLLPAELRARAGVEAPGPVAVVGQGNVFELWAAERWAAESDQCFAALPQYVDRIADLGL